MLGLDTIGLLFNLITRITSLSIKQLYLEVVRLRFTHVAIQILLHVYRCLLTLDEIAYLVVFGIQSPKRVSLLEDLI